jgi:dipeptidyl aminopeptidase/acylaminoacyl peptidase
LRLACADASPDELGARLPTRTVPLRIAKSHSSRRGAFGLASGVLLLLAAQAAFPQGSGPPPRGLSVNDLLRLEDVVDWDIASGRGDVALVVRRSLASPKRFEIVQDFASGLLGADLVILPADGSAPRNITNGGADSSGAFFPAWSPDGRHLAFVSNRGSGNTWLYVWDRASGHITRVSSLGVDVAQGKIDAGDGTWRPLHWTSDSTVLVTFLPEGVAPWSEEAPHAAPAAWNRKEVGAVATASALESPTREDGKGRRASLRLVNIRRGSAMIVATYPYFNYGETRLSPARYVSVAPSGKRVALLVRTGTVPMGPDTRLGRFNVRTRQLGIASIERPGAVEWLSGNAFRQIGEWSPDGSHLSVWTAPTDTGSSSNALATVSVGDNDSKVSPVVLANFTPAPFASPVWSAEGRLLVYGRENPTVVAPGGTAPRNDWWAVRLSGERVNTTASLSRVPSRLLRIAHGQLIGAAGGSLWRLDPERGTVVALPLGDGIGVTSIVAPGFGPLTTPLASFVVTARVDKMSRYYHLHLTDTTPTITELSRPSKAADVVSYNPANEVALFYESGPTGNSVWVNRRERTEVHPSMSLNTFLADVSDSHRALVSYQSTKGDSITGVLLLPPDYSPARRYPLVVSVYGGDIADDTTEYPKNDPSELNLNLLSGHGFAVFIPSMPLAPYGEAMADPMRELTTGVLPGIAKVVEMGIADSTRVAVMGFSYGGYSVYALITQTKVFKAAVAISGPADLVSQYGEFGAAQYGSAPHEFLFSPVGMEGGWGHLGGTPWTNLASYTRNSPFYALDRVETPTLILHGDLDSAVPISQSEQVFSALFRLGKRARFVRYWGETHGFSSPANIRDLWREVFQWLDTFLK